MAHILTRREDESKRGAGRRSGRENDEPLGSSILYTQGLRGYTARMSDTSPPKRRRFQYSLRTLFAFTALVAAGMSWFCVKREQASKQREVVNSIQALGGQVYGYDYEYDEAAYHLANAQSPAPAWLRRMLGDDFFSNLGSVTLIGPDVTDAALERLDGLGNPRRLAFERTSVTDEGLKHLETLSNLRELRLWRANVGDEGLVHLRRLTNLQTLWLPCTRITDAGLVHLKGLTRLRSLRLGSTNVSDPGLECLKGLTNLQVLGLQGTKVTDVGLGCLERLTNLRRLGLDWTVVTDGGLEHLRRLTNLQYLSLEGTKVTDLGLTHLRELANLRALVFEDTEVTHEAVVKLQQILPKCEMYEPLPPLPPGTGTGRRHMREGL
jgi:hypothetical protein